MTEPAPAVVGVLIADDNDAYRSGMVRAIHAHAGLDLVAEVRDGDEALAGLREFKPAVALLDIRMPGLDGLEVCRRAREEGLATRTILLSAYMDDGVVARALEVGADAYLSKADSRRDICAAVLRVGLGEDEK